MRDLYEYILLLAIDGHNLAGMLSCYSVKVTCLLEDTVDFTDRTVGENQLDRTPAI